MASSSPPPPPGTITKQIMVGKWYFGGLASAGAAIITHPMDLLKVQMQTHKGKKMPILELIRTSIHNDGYVKGLYSGVSASLLRQLTYSMARFGIYEVATQRFTPMQSKGAKEKGKNPKVTVPFHISALMAGLGGFVGGFVGNPADLINVRMQNDVKTPKAQRIYNYRHVFHGLHQVITTEGVKQLWAGASMTCTRATLMTIGQLSFYNLIKEQLLATPYFKDNVKTHVLSSLLAGMVATTMTQPVDVLKTRAMNTQRAEFHGIFHLVKTTAMEGPLAFYKGYIPAFVRLAPHTVLTFVFLEQLRMRFGTAQTITVHSK